jgi:hypothetical protein
MIFCTVTTKQYIFLAINMAKSVKMANPDARVMMCLVEEDYSQVYRHLEHFDHVILAKELGFPNFYRHIFKHSGYEASGSFKAKLMHYALDKFKDENMFIFVDSDMKIFGPLNEIPQALQQHDIILSPHILERGNNDGLYLAGIFNSGFFAIKRSEQSYHFLNWWADRIEKACFNEPEKGLFLEQKWLDHAPVFFKIHVLKHPGYNVAWWNLHERKIELSNHGVYTVNGQPLKMFHFSGILKSEGNYIDFLNRRTGSEVGNPLGQLVHQYIKQLQNIGINFSKVVPWSYDFFINGKPIKMEARLAFRQNPQKFAHILNPFLKRNRTFLKQKKERKR